MSIIGELAVALGFEVDDSKLQQFSKGIDSAIGNLFKLTAAAGVVVAALDRITDSTIRGTTAMMNFNAQTGLSIDKLQRFSIAAQLQNIGLSADDVTSSIMNLQGQLAQIRMGQGNIAPFQLAGVDVLGQDAFGVIDQLREKIQGLDDATATNLISQMGLNPNFITVLRMTNDEFSWFSKQIALTAQERKQIMELGIEIRKLKMQIEAFFNKAVAANAHLLEKVAKFLQNVVYGMQKLHLMVPLLTVGLLGILRTFRLLNMATLGWTAALLGLFLLLDDFAVWSKGGKSLFDYSGLQKFFDVVIPQVEKLSKATGGLTGLMDLATIGSGAWMGFNIGKFFGPWGAGIGAGVGAVGGLGLDIYMHSQGASGGEQRTVNQTNNWNIHSNASDPQDVARAIQPQLDDTMLYQDNGGY